MSHPSSKCSDGVSSTSTASRALSPRPNHQRDLADHLSRFGEAELGDFFDLYLQPQPENDRETNDKIYPDFQVDNDREISDDLYIQQQTRKDREKNGEACEI